VKRYGARLPLVCGPLVAALGFTLFTRPGVGGSYWTTFFPAVVVLGLGMAISVAPLTTTVMNAVPENRAGIASGINNAVSRAAGLLAVAVLGLVMLHTFNAWLDSRLSAPDITPETRRVLDEQRNKLAGAELPESLAPEVRSQLKQAIDTAFVSGFRRLMWVAAAMAALSALSAWLMIRD
jgi:hypothetical protein